MSLTCAVAYLAFFIGFTECFVLDDNSNILHDDQWRCDTICGGSGGRAELNTENKICKCTPDKHADAIDMELILKKALNLGLELVDFDNGKLRKREAPNTETDIRVVGQPKSKFTFPRPKPSVNPSPFRNAQSNRRSPIVAPKRQLPTARKAATSGISVDAQKRLKELQKRLQKRMKELTRNAPRLQQRAGFSEGKQENILEQIKEKRTEIQGKRTEIQEKLKARMASLSPSNAGTKKKASGKPEIAVLGTQQKSNDNPVHKNTEPAKPPSSPNEVNKLEIATQDPNLYSVSEEDEN